MCKIYIPDYDEKLKVNFLPKFITYLSFHIIIVFYLYVCPRALCERGRWAGPVVSRDREPNTKDHVAEGRWQAARLASLPGPALWGGHLWVSPALLRGHLWVGSSTLRKASVSEALHSEEGICESGPAVGAGHFKLWIIPCTVFNSYKNAAFCQVLWSSEVLGRPIRAPTPATRRTESTGTRLPPTYKSKVGWCLLIYIYITNLYSPHRKMYAHFYVV